MLRSSMQPQDLPSPSSTTAWITMGNTPRSRSKFSFMERESTYKSYNRCKCNTIALVYLAVLSTPPRTTVKKKTKKNSLHLPLSNHWSLFWKTAWRTVGSLLACNAQFQRPSMDLLGCTCITKITKHTNERSRLSFKCEDF